MSKQHVTVVMGGPSVEYEVSLDSGNKIIEHLDRNAYSVEKIHITKDRRWLVGEAAQEYSVREALDYLEQQNSTVFIAIHGTFGEDGTIQALFERHGIQYTGSDVSASLLAMDKVTSQELFAGVGLSVIPTLVFDKDSSAQAPALVEKEIADYPLIVKPARLGSSVGVQIVRDAKKLPTAIRETLLYDQEVIVQPLIAGRELACAVLEVDGQLQALPATELIPVISEFFDYKAKYQPGGTKEITPPDMDKKLLKRVQDAAVLAHKTVGCRSYSRSDFIIKGDDMYILEINTLPGMTQTSLVPQQAAAAGIPFSRLLDIIVANAQSAV